VNDLTTRLYVGNLPYTLRNGDLRQLFSSFGKVVDAVVMMEKGDRERSKGFGFVSMSMFSEANIAAAQMNGKEVLGRVLVCNIAKPRENNTAF
jgi:cold-inducible RNA-binding protein